MSAICAICGTQGWAGNKMPGLMVRSSKGPAYIVHRDPFICLIRIRQQKATLGLVPHGSVTQGKARS